MYKECTKCKKSKIIIEDFHQLFDKKVNKTYYRNICKDCMREKARSEYSSTARKLYYQNNKEKELSAKKLWNLRNPNYSKEYYVKNIEACREYDKKRSLSRVEYNSYTNMIGRCYNAKSQYYKDYGGRGISVCDRWRFGENNKSGFECFKEDMGKRPGGFYEYYLERINNDGNYEPQNCKWATFREQSLNRRGSLKCEYEGKMRSLVEISDMTGIPYYKIRYRFKNNKDLISGE